MHNLTESELHVVHTKLLELLSEFKNICEKENIWYTLAFGTVLGAVRHKGFIPWDTDADVCIKLEDVERFREAFIKHSNSDITLNRYDSDKSTKSHDTMSFKLTNQIFRDLHLDIYPLVGAPNNPRRQSIVLKRNYLLDRVFRSKYVNINDCLEKNKRKVFIVKLIDQFIPDSIIKANIKHREREFNVEQSDYLTCLAAPYMPVPKQCWNSIIKLPFEDSSFNIPGNFDLYLRSLYGDYMTPKKY